MNAGIKISIIVPIYNTEKYLSKCLNSIIAQTLKEIEIICIDDGSNDNSLTVIQEYARIDKRIKIITQNNQKQGTARNKGIESARGEYIGFVDSDDYIQEDFFEKLYSIAKSYGADISCASIIRKRDNSQKYRLKYNNTYVVKDINEKLKICTSISGDYSWNVWNKIYRKDFLLSNNIYFEENVYFEDVNFTIKAIHLSNCIVTVPNTYYYYYARFNSIVKGQQNDKKRQDLLHAYTQLYNYCIENNIRISKTNSYCTQIYLKLFNLIILSSKIKFQDKWIFSSLKLFNIFSLSYRKSPNPLVCYSFPVDIVYTWCNGRDDKFKQEKQLWLNKCNITNADFNFQCQWNDNDELKYSIRSIEKYASWIRNIFIITNNQVPEWLVNYNSNRKKNLPEIKIINVSDIMPKESLPTFNSQAIETCLSYIKDLSEHFLYACDDMFFNAPVDKSFFFNLDGKPIVRLQSEISAKTCKKSQYARSIISAQNKVKEKYNKLYKQAPHHCIDSYTKTSFIDCINDFKNEFHNTTFHKFRQENSVQRAIILYRALANNQAVMRLTKPFGILTRDSKCIAVHSPKKIRYLKNKSIKLFCINDDNKATQSDRQVFKDFLEQKFWNKSIYEE